MAVMNGLYQMPNRGVTNNRTQSPVISRDNQNANNAYQQYQQNMINTASPQELTLMLYNGLVKFIKLAMQETETKNPEKAHINIIRSQDIIFEFMNTLDMNYEISKSLMSLYDYMNRRLVDANLKKDKAIMEEVLGYAEELRDTWAQAMKLVKQQVVNK